MIADKITEYTIFESPDGGETVYARMPGSNERIKISESEKVKTLREELTDNQLWYNIRNEAKTNAALREAIDRVILLYHLAKGNNNG
jgi:hypothetical protein